MNHRRKLLIGLGASVFAAPFASFAQTQSTRIARIGILSPGSAASNAGSVAALLAELRALGYVEGKNIALEPRWIEAALDRLPAAAAELVGLKVDAILTFQTPSAQAAKQATRAIPIIMAGAADPVASGLIASLARPGGNVTGLSGAISDLAAKTLELLRDMLPATKRVGVLANSADPFSKVFVERIELAGRHLGINLMTLSVRGEEGLEAAFEEMTKAKAGAVIVQPSLPLKRAADLAIKYRLASASPLGGFAANGGLLAYAGNTAERFRDIAFYLDKILKGAKPADLPVQQPRRFEMVVNLKTAKAIGLTVPDGFLVRADKVIE